MYTSESRNTFHCSPFTNSDCSFWQSGWERFLFALGAKTALSDHTDIDPWCPGDLEMTSSEWQSRSQRREPLRWVQGFNLPQIAPHSCFQHFIRLWSDSFWMKANSSSKGPLLKRTHMLLWERRQSGSVGGLGTAGGRGAREWTTRLGRTGLGLGTFIFYSQS